MAININPNQQQLGIDGDWTTFGLEVDGQQIWALPSTSQNASYVVGDQSCTVSGTSKINATCSADFGKTFNPQSPWTFVDQKDPLQVLSVPYVGPYIGYSQNVGAQYGTGTVGLIAYGSVARYTSKGKLIVGILYQPPFGAGLLGLVPMEFALPSKFHAQSKSLLQNFKETGQIPSLSWGYTAGAPYELDNKGPVGSLVLGGFDESRISTSYGISIAMDKNPAKYLTVAIQSIKTSTKDFSKREVLSKPIYAALDSTYSQMWLPSDACDVLAKAFKLQYDHASGLYFIGKSDREAFLTQNPMPYVNFTLSSGLKGSPIVPINIPYAAFDKMVMPPYPNITKQHHYFPIKRGGADTPFTLGRTFLQQAYVIADWERGNFSVYPALFAEGNTVPKLVTIKPPVNPKSVKTTHPSSSSSSPAGVIAGVVVAVVVLIILGLVGWWFWRRRRRSRHVEKPESPAPPYTDHIRELHGDQQYGRKEKAGTELDAMESGRNTPMFDAKLSASRMMGSSPLASPDAPRAELSGTMQSPRSEMDATQYFELPGSEDQRRSLGPQELNATVSPTTDLPDHSAISTSPPLPAPPEPSPPLETSTMTTNPLSAFTDRTDDSIPPPPPPK